jgi:hypothetical protein
VSSDEPVESVHTGESSSAQVGADDCRSDGGEDVQPVYLFVWYIEPIVKT